MAKFYLDRYFAKAQQIRFETPVYDYYEDDEGFEQRDCVREGTSKKALCKQVQKPMPLSITFVGGKAER